MTSLKEYLEAEWTVRDLAMFIGLRGELHAMARELPEKPTKGQIDRFRVAIVASCICARDSELLMVPSRYVTKKALTYWVKCPVIDLAKVREARSVRAFVRKRGDLLTQPIADMLPPGPYAKC